MLNPTPVVPKCDHHNQQGGFKKEISGSDGAEIMEISILRDFLIFS